MCCTKRGEGGTSLLFIVAANHNYSREQVNTAYVNDNVEITNETFLRVGSREENPTVMVAQNCKSFPVDRHTEVTRQTNV